MRIFRQAIYESTQLLNQKGIEEHRRIVNKSNLANYQTATERVLREIYNFVEKQISPNPSLPKRETK